MEMLNQSISPPVQHQHHNNCPDLGAVGNYVQHTRQQQSQMSGPFQRPSNGSNILEQHAMRPATTGDPSNCVFNDQDNTINGHLQNEGVQMQAPNMMGMQNNMMVSNTMMQTSTSSRLPPITLNNNNTYTTAQTVQSHPNGRQTMQPSVIQLDSPHQSQQMNQCYEQTAICQNKLAPMTMKEQLFGQQSMNSQQMVNPPRMNTPVLQQHLPPAPQHYQNPKPQMMQQKQNCTMGGQGRMMSNYHQNSDQTHLSHMDPPTQHSMNSVSQTQQHPAQMSHNSHQVQSPTNLSTSSSSGSPARLPSLTFGNTPSQMVNQSNIPMNANSTTQLLMALNSNSPITAEQLQEIQSMTCVAPDGNEMLLMQEPRLKQYSSLKEMSTNDLRSECKKRNLSSTGTKVRLSERLAEFEADVLDERNHQMMMEYTHRQQMYEAQAATLKAFQAKKALLQVQSGGGQSQNFSSQVVSSNEISSTTQSMPTLTQQNDGPPAKKKRVAKPKKATVVPDKSKNQQSQQTQQMNNTNSEQQISNGNMNNGGIMNMISSNNQSTITLGSIGNQGAQRNQNLNSNIFGNVNQPGSGFFMKDNTCFSHLGSGCRLISTSSSEDSQTSSFGSNGRSFQSTVPPPPQEPQMYKNDQQDFGINDHMSQPRNEMPSRPMNLSQNPNQNQQQLLGNQTMNQNISNMFNIPVTQPTQTQQQHHLQQQPQQQPPQAFVNGIPQNGLQGSPCVADQAGPSPNMPVSDPTATTSESPVVVSSVVENTDSAEMMDIETMQQLLSPATLRAREELLTQQQSRINELVKLIQKNHDTLREQQMQINLAKKQQKLRQRQNVPQTCVIDKHVNSRCLQQAIKSRQNFHVLSELTKQQDSIRTAETRLIEQLHINTATDDIARLIKQDGRTALVIVSLLHDYRTTREQNNRVKTTDSVSDKNEVTKKKTPARKRNHNGTKTTGQNKKSVQQQQQQPDIEVVQVISAPQTQQQQVQQVQQRPTQFLEFPQPQTTQRPRTQSDVDMEAIFKTVIDASRTSQANKNMENQQKQQQFDNEVISLPSEGSSPTHIQSQNSVQSGYSDNYSTKNMGYQQDNSPQQMSHIVHMNNGNNSTYSPSEMHHNSADLSQQQLHGKQPEAVETLPQLEQNAMDHEMENHRFHENINFGDSLGQNSRNNVLDFEFPDIDQMVANIRESDPLSCPLDDIDLTAILNSWTDNCDSKPENGEHSNQQEQQNNICDNMLFGQNSQLDQMGQLQEDLDWNDYNTQSNIINQAFEQSQLQ